MRPLEYYILASIYLSPSHRRTVLKIFKKASKYKSIPEIDDIDLELLAKHCSQAERLDKGVKVILVSSFLAATACIFLLPATLNYIATALILLSVMIHLTYKEYKFENFVFEQLKKADIKDWQVDNYDETLLKTVNKFKSPVIRYFKNFDPYSSNGIHIHGWAFTIDVTKSNDLYGPQPKEFYVADLYGKINRDIKSLKIDTLSVKDGLYVDGVDIHKDKRFYSNKTLVNCFTSEELFELRNSKFNHIRYYDIIQIKDWGNQLVLNILIRLYKTSENLYIQAKFFQKPPTISADLKELVDKKLDKQKNSIAALFIDNILATPVQMVFSTLETLAAVDSLVEKVSFSKSDIENREKKDLAACPNIENHFRSLQFQNSYQSEDTDYYIKIIEKRILNSVIQFLKENNINTSDFEETKTQILNNGIMISGGKVKADNLSAGSNNRLNKVVKSEIS